MKVKREYLCNMSVGGIGVVLVDGRGPALAAAKRGLFHLVIEVGAASLW